MNNIKVDLKLKERTGTDYKIIDNVKGVKVEEAIFLLQHKYLTKEKRKSLMQKLDVIYEETTKELERVLTRR